MNKPLRILLVEDNPGDADLIQEMLPATDDSGFTVHCVSRLSDAVPHLQNDAIDLALLDLDLPDSHGIDTVRSARRAAPQMPIVVLTGNQDEGIGMAAVQGGAQDFLVKGQTHRSHLSRVIRYAIERQSAEEKVRESERFLRSTLDALSAHIAIIDATGQILAVNQAWRIFADVNGEHVLRSHEGTNYFDVCKSIQDQQAEDACSAMLFAEGVRDVLENKKGFFEMEYSMKGLCGEHWFHGRVTPYPEGIEHRVVIAHEDITDRKRAEKEKIRLSARLQHSYKMEAIGTLAGGIAHDFNNILSSVIGYVELSMLDVEKGGMLEKNLQEVYRAGMRAKDLVQQILTFARREENHIQPIQVSSIAKEASKLIRSTTPSSIEVRLEVMSEAFVMAEPTQIHQIFMNLLTNAVQAMEINGGLLTVRITETALDHSFHSMHPVFKPGDFLQIVVSDTGKGIPQQMLERIFDPYFTTKGNGEGMGLGLSVVHGIVKSHGGEITVESKPGQGTQISVYLPLSTHKGAVEIPINRSPPTGTERILFVDDERPIADMSRKRLDLLGYQVTAMYNSHDALARLSKSPDDFDLIITDMTMPKMSGDELAMKAKKIKPGLPIILCTGYSKKISKEEAAIIGIDAFLMKPVALREMAETIRKVLAGKAF